MVVDERPTGWGTLDGKGFLRRLEQLIEFAPDAVMTCAAVHQIADNGSAAGFQVSGTLPGGGAFGLAFEAVAFVDNGRLIRLELLPEDQVDEARRRLASATDAD